MEKYTIKSYLKSRSARVFTKGGKKHWHVGISLSGDESALDKIRYVKYILHRTFRNPTRISDDRSSNFEIDIRTYGYFDVKAIINFNDGGDPEEISGYVKFEV